MGGLALPAIADGMRIAEVTVAVPAGPANVDGIRVRQVGGSDVDNFCHLGPLYDVVSPDVLAIPAWEAAQQYLSAGYAQSPVEPGLGNPTETGKTEAGREEVLGQPVGGAPFVDGHLGFLLPGRCPGQLLIPVFYHLAVHLLNGRVSCVFAALITIGQGNTAE